MKIVIIVFIFLCLLGPAIILLTGQVSLFGDYRTANRDSANLAPDASETSEAVVQLYTARAFNWHGLFSVHTWIATKSENDKQYKTYQVVGWRKFRNLDPLVIENGIPDRNWFNQKPTLLLDLRGKQAEKIIPEIEAAAKAYPYPKDYVMWPGPNSNTFTAFILRKVPALHVAMPSNAVGKDYLGGFTIFAPAPSHTGYQISLFGIFGILIAKEEGLEINIFGLVFGFNPFIPSLKLPGLGDLSFEGQKV